ncbi:hypothetical protein EMO90_04665 [Bifidobacterium vespertilionis]|uniref:Uncharacterized protein n=2 Tax=Bifidobacterium vespertilionis TaxID=2562524 RepID=A0A5J5DW52_9BIFI|nr:hypothetical protein EMO90_04665 [Bifidobacterium vespertilionis]KAA8821240.1 hypothetical protein EM848_11105 [Bifidobacterium vespertilionis]
MLRCIFQPDKSEIVAFSIADNLPRSPQMARLAGGFVRHARNMNTRGCLVANGWVASHPDEYVAELWRGCAATYGLRGPKSAIHSTIGPKIGAKTARLRCESRISARAARIFAITRP